MSRLRTFLSLVLVVAAAACGGPSDGPAGGPRTLVVDYPHDGSVFPPEFVPPTFLWHDDTRADTWRVVVSFADGGPDLVLRADGAPPPDPVIDPDAIRENNEVYRGTEYQRSARTWTPAAAEWEAIKNRSVMAKATLVFTGRSGAEPDRALSRGEVRISVSKDPVGAPIFYRDVPLMPAIGNKGVIQPLAPDAIPLINWRLKDVSKPDSRVVLKNMPTCANCHSFSRDGKTLGMDVDSVSTGDKGSYMVTPVSEEMVVTDDHLMSWNEFEDKPEGHRTIGFLSRIHPTGKYVVTTLNEMIYVANFPDYKFLQVFYPTRGILGWYSTETREIKALPGADDTDYVHCSPSFTPDGESLVFMRATAFDPYRPDLEMAEYPNDPREPRIRYDLYRMPFNGGRGGTPVPVKGASDNGMSNTFPKVSPDGKWIVFTQCENGQLMRPDGRLWIVPFEGGEAREMTCNTALMNSWHSFSPNGRWMVFSSKTNRPYTQMFLTHIDEDGNDTPAILIPNATADNRAVNLPEFVNGPADVIMSMDVPAVTHHRKFQSARKHILKSEYAEAIALAKEALEKEPGFTRARVLLGWGLVESGEVEEGILEFRRVLGEDPNDSNALHSLGLAFDRLGRKEESLTHLELAVERGVGARRPEILKSLGRAYLERGKIDEALAVYLKAETLEQGDPSIHESLAAIYFRQGRVREALKRLGEVRTLAADNAHVRMVLAMYLATSPDDGLRDGPRAVEVAKEACEITEWKQPAALDVLAAAYAESGRWDEAVETARKAVDGARRQGLESLSRILGRLRLYERKLPFRQGPERR